MEIVACCSTQSFLLVLLAATEKDEEDLSGEGLARADFSLDEQDGVEQAEGSNTEGDEHFNPGPHVEARHSMEDVEQDIIDTVLQPGLDEDTFGHAAAEARSLLDEEGQHTLERRGKQHVRGKDDCDSSPAEVAPDGLQEGGMCFISLPQAQSHSC